MNNEYKFKYTGDKPRVLTAKVLDNVFNKVEKFKADAQLDNRNAAINVLVILGLYNLSYFSEKEAKALIGKHLWDRYFEEGVQ
ncbi:hypothetical protein [Methanomethylophilus alvi]|uniref:hypothetical protein n=1 Tax=Methanomethylophilus alvi TaxID=1291540 RepID=UPI0037DD4BD0